MTATLTDFEMAGLHSYFCLADGHAYQDLHPAFKKVVTSLPQIWHQSASLTIPEAETQFNELYASFINAPILKNFDNFAICPTASNSIDLVGALLHCLKYSVAMIEPTFDNLALLLKRRGVQMSAIADHTLYDAAESNTLDALMPELQPFDALFIVHPNNPTGLVLSEEAFKNIVSFCHKYKKTLVIDNCFRVYRRNLFSDYEILINSGVSFIAFEDTGKVWPTQDLKASLIYYSDDLKATFEELYNEVYLCVSNFSLGILSGFFRETMKTGLDETIWDIVDTRRNHLRKALAGTDLSVPEIARNSKLPVEWLAYSGNDKNDFALCNELKKLNLAVLPGRQFYWNSASLPQHQQFVRVSLMKKERVFYEGLQILEHYCKAGTETETQSINNKHVAVG